MAVSYLAAAFTNLANAEKNIKGNDALDPAEEKRCGRLISSVARFIDYVQRKEARHATSAERNAKSQERKVDRLAKLVAQQAKIAARIAELKK